MVDAREVEERIELYTFVLNVSALKIFFKRYFNTLVKISIFSTS